MGFESDYIWMDGVLVAYQEATVPFLSSALHYGLGVFEGIRCYSTEQGPAIFRLGDHMQRLLNSAHILGFKEVGFTLDQLCDAVKLTVQANKMDRCYIRPLIHHATNTPSLNLDLGEARIGIAVWRWDSFLGEEAQQNGIRVNVSSYTRHHPNVMMTKSKMTGNYSNSVMAKTESVRLGFDEAIMLDPQGYVSECTSENLFIVRGGKIQTPLSSTVLEGITRDSLMVLANDLGYSIEEKVIVRDQLYIADEIFVTGTAAEVVAVTEVDFRKIGSGQMGPITRELQQAFQSVVAGRHARSSEWLDYVKS